MGFFPGGACLCCGKASGLERERQYHSAFARTTPGEQLHKNYTDAVVTPPSITMVWPVMKLEASEPR